MPRQRDEAWLRRLTLRQVQFGAHLKSLRDARGWTHQQMAERSTLAIDTISRLERGSFSPSIRTIFKLADGLELSVSTIFAGFENGARQHRAEMGDLLRSLSPAELDAAARVLRLLVQSLDLSSER